MSRTFVARPAVREKTPILIGLVGPSSSGKTYSALRLASGGRRVTGGKVFVIDTEARRSLHYAEKFEFEHVPFGAPFSPDDYLAAIEFCVKEGGPGSWIVIDSMSLEHEGKGGVLEMHEAELDKRAGTDWKKREALNMLCWAKPKAARRRMINAILQMEANFVFCFRAKPKIKMVKGEDPVQLGYQAIAGDEFIYEMSLKCLLLPGADGRPTIQSNLPGEQALIKIPEQFRPLLASRPQLSEDVGEALAKWASGSVQATAKPIATADDLLKSLAACSEGATLRSLQADSRAAWTTFSKGDKDKIAAAVKAAEQRIAKANEAPPEPRELTEDEKRAIEAEETKAAANG
jgi:hypothetical protein